MTSRPSFTRESPLAIVSVPGRTQPCLLPFVSDECCGCGNTQDLSNPDGFSPSRVAGDSANGYEPWCNACDEQVIVELRSAFPGLVEHADGSLTVQT